MTGHENCEYQPFETDPQPVRLLDERVSRSTLELWVFQVLENDNPGPHYVTKVRLIHSDRE